MQMICPSKIQRIHTSIFTYHADHGFSKPKTSGKIKTAFCKKWLEKTEEIIGNKPKDLPFCKVVAAITYPDVRESQIIIFYDEEYYNSFWTGKDLIRYGREWMISVPLQRKRNHDKVA